MCFDIPHIFVLMLCYEVHSLPTVCVELFNFLGDFLLFMSALLWRNFILFRTAFDNMNFMEFEIVFTDFHGIACCVKFRGITRANLARPLDIIDPSVGRYGLLV